ncbi:MAG TPA: phosphate ABC transporter permease PstA [Myxococcota bacterium]|nr:phosphate ABC transporter permease PstA [Myxococcota bacterium]
MTPLPVFSRRAGFGDAMLWLAGGALSTSLLLVIGLVVLVAWNGLGYFWQGPLAELELADGSRVLGEIVERHAAELRIRLGNRDLGGDDFRWIQDADIRSTLYPEDALLLERTEYGRFYGFPVALRNGERELLHGAPAVLGSLDARLAAKRAERALKLDGLRAEIRHENVELERLRLARRDAAAVEARYEASAAELTKREAEYRADVLGMRTADGREQSFPLANVVRAVRANDLGVGGKLALYASRIGEFLWADPRESNTEGGIFPAIFGTVLLVLLTSIAVSPLGVLTALYLREYAKEGPFVRSVRIAVNSLAGVPSIVFGVFGLGFFVYGIGGAIDTLFFADRLPTPTFGTGGLLWAGLTLALLTLPVVVVATEEGLAAVPRVVREGSLALGATKVETLLRVVLPAALPGALTGLILAMARAAGEVAPLMIVGMVKLAPSLPLDGEFPFVHLERKFMHLGFHIYDVGFQSPNVEAVRPLVFATALLLILVVLCTNLTAILIRNHLRRKYAGSGV